MNRPSWRAVIVFVGGVFFAHPVPAVAQPDTAPDTVGVFLQQYCVKCHGGREPKAKLSLEGVAASTKIAEDRDRWQRVLGMLESGEMPPDDERQPSVDERRQVLAAITARLADLDCDIKRPGRVTIRRLNRAEYNRTIRDLVGIDFRPADDFPSDDVGAGFDNIGAVLTLPPLLMEKYLNAADEIVRRVIEDRDVLRQLTGGRREGERFPERARRIITRFATRAFRRPASPDEVDRLMALAEVARQRGLDDRDQIGVMFTAVLVSPHFLFRVELDPDPNDPQAIRILNDYELATRMSYFLWSSMPDDELMRLAAEGRLSQPAVLEEQVRRMIADPKSDAMVETFAGQWLQLRSLADVAPDPERFPEFDDALRSSMLRETELFFSAVMREDRSVLDFLDADFTFVDERLARHYGMEGVSGEGFQQVALDGRRTGVLTHASILTLTSNPTRTSPVKRGKWILENVLGTPPPPPPPNVEELAEDDEQELLGTLRERMEQHRADPNCATCHRSMDPLGFGLENFDAVGAWRTQDGRFDIDPSGELPGGENFAGPVELMKVLKQSRKDDFCRCLARKMLTFALGRGLESYDECALEAMMKRMEAGEFRFSALVLGIIESDPFRMRGSTGAKP